MAVNTVSKRLHRHAMPVVVLSVGLFLVSTIGITQFVSGNTRANDTVTRLLTNRLFSVRQGTNGLFSISRYQPSNQAASRSLSVPATNTGLGQISTSGVGAELSVVIDSVNQTK